MTTLTKALALVLGASALALAPSSTAQAASTCQGLPATIEADSGTVSGTSGADVIVVSGTVRHVEAGDGDDLVCLVDTIKLPGRNRQISVDSGAGDDQVDASAAGAATNIFLRPGADGLVGSPYRDYVEVGDRSAPLAEPGDPGPYTVTTGAGQDTLIVHVGAVVDAHLGQGSDGIRFRAAEGGSPSHVDLGPGLDSANFNDEWDDTGAGETILRVDLTGDVMEWHGVTSVLLRAENIKGTARTIRVRGDEGPNGFFSFGCDVRFVGGPGDDYSTMKTSGIGDTQPFTCKPEEVRRAFGNGGNDILNGGRSHDVLIGGPGRDEAYGGPAGDDRCFAEIISGKGCLD